MEKKVILFQNDALILFADYKDPQSLPPDFEMGLSVNITIRKPQEEAQKPSE